MHGVCHTVHHTRRFPPLRLDQRQVGVIEPEDTKPLIRKPAGIRAGPATDIEIDRTRLRTAPKPPEKSETGFKPYDRPTGNAGVIIAKGRELCEACLPRLLKSAFPNSRSGRLPVGLRFPKWVCNGRDRQPRDWSAAALIECCMHRLDRNILNLFAEAAKVRLLFRHE